MQAVQYIFETERLRLRQFTLADTQFIIELLNSAGWLQFIGDRNVKTEEDAVAYLQNGPLKSYSENGFGLSMVETKSGEKAGMCGIIRRDNLEHPDIGFAMLPQFAGKGFGVEIAKATMDYALHTMGIQKIVAITLPNNERSIRVLEKIGLSYSRSFASDSAKEELLLFE